MGTAAYCSECQGYVWLGPDGACSNGHARPFLRDVHQAATLPSPIGVPPTGPASVSGDDASRTTNGPGPDAPPAAALPDPLEGIPLAPAPPPHAAPYAPPVTQLSADGLPAGVGRFSWGAFLIPVFWCLAYGLPSYAGIAFGAALLTRAVGLLVPELDLIGSFALIGVYVWIGFAAPKAYWRKYPHKMSAEEYRRKQVKWVVIGIVGPLLLLALVVASVSMYGVPTPL